jgi:hypothetical protein
MWTTIIAAMIPRAGRGRGDSSGGERVNLSARRARLHREDGRSEMSEALALL